VPFLGWAAEIAVISSHAIHKNPGFLGKSAIGRLFPVKPNRIEYRALQPIMIRSAGRDPADWQGK